MQYSDQYTNYSSTLIPDVHPNRQLILSLANLRYQFCIFPENPLSYISFGNFAIH